MDFCGNLIDAILKRVILYQMWPRFRAKMVQNLAKDLLGIKSEKLILELWTLFLDHFWAAFSYCFVYSTWKYQTAPFYEQRRALNTTFAKKSQKPRKSHIIRLPGTGKILVLSFCSVASHLKAMQCDSMEIPNN